MNVPANIGSEYVLEIPYTWGYFDYQAPPLINYTAARAGHSVPDLDQHFNYCDLGCGNGVTAVMLAAAFPKAHIWGIDFNPEHIVNARVFAEQAGVKNVTFLDVSFGQAALQDLPPMDYITMQGIYSWVSCEVQDEIHDFIEQKAAEHCLIYLCYNAYPGATKLLPMWKMMQSFGNGNGKAVTENVPGGLKLLQKIEALDGRFFRENPSASKRLGNIAKRDISYLVHEFGNGAFEPQFFADLNGRFVDQGFQFAGSAELLRNTHENVVSSKFTDLLAEVPEASEREAVFSFVANETFRWDVFIRGKEAVSEDKSSKLNGLFFSLSCAADKAKGRWELGRRRLNLDDRTMQKIVNALDGRCLSLDALAGSTGMETLSRSALVKYLDQLLGSGVVIPAARPSQEFSLVEGQRFEIKDAVNRAHLRDRLFVDGRAYFASPVLGTAIRLSLCDSCCVLALTDSNVASPEASLFQLLSEHEHHKSVRRRFRKAGITESSVAKYLDGFRVNTLPNLVMWEILEPS